MVSGLFAQELRMVRVLWHLYPVWLENFFGCLVPVICCFFKECEKTGGRVSIASHCQTVTAMVPYDSVL